MMTTDTMTADKTIAAELNARLVGVNYRVAVPRAGVFYVYNAGDVAKSGTLAEVKAYLDLN